MLTFCLTGNPEKNMISEHKSGFRKFYSEIFMFVECDEIPAEFSVILCYWRGRKDGTPRCRVRWDIVDATSP